MMGHSGNAAAATGVDTGAMSEIGTFRRSAIVPLWFWMQNSPVRKDLCNAIFNNRWSLAPLFAQRKHNGEKQSHQCSKECFGDREAVEGSQSLPGQNKSDVRHC